MPPLFVLGDKGAAELVNYRVQGRFMIVDRLFERAELRLGSGGQRNQSASIAMYFPISARFPSPASIRRASLQS